MAKDDKLLLAIKPYDDIVKEFMKNSFGSTCFRGTSENPFNPEKTIAGKKVTNVEAFVFHNCPFFHDSKGILQRDFFRVSFDVTKPSLFSKPEVNGMHLFYGVLYSPLTYGVDPLQAKQKFWRMGSVIKDTGFSFNAMPLSDTQKYKVLAAEFESDISFGKRGCVIFVHASIPNIRCSYHKGEPEKNEATPEQAMAYLKEVFCQRILANMKKAVEETMAAY